VQWHAIVSQTRLDGIAVDTLARLADEVGKGRERHELPRRKQVAEPRQAVLDAPDGARIVGKFAVRHPRRLGRPCDRLMLLIRRQVDPSALALGDDRHQLGAHPAGPALRLDVLVG